MQKKCIQVLRDSYIDLLMTDEKMMTSPLSKPNGVCKVNLKYIQEIYNQEVYIWNVS